MSVAAKQARIRRLPVAGVEGNASGRDARDSVSSLIVTFELRIPSDGGSQRPNYRVSVPLPTTACRTEPHEKAESVLVSAHRVILVVVGARNQLDLQLA